MQAMRDEVRTVAEPGQAGIAALGDIVWQPGRWRVAVVGASKNAGKTTALNALVAAAARRGERVGLVSIGLDGEAYDAWLDIPKPPVRVEKGTLVITAASAAQPGQLRVLADAGFVSALGPTVLAEARAPGGVQLCGVPHRGHLVQAVRQLQQAGAERVLIDGAYHRQAAAHRDVADAVVVAVGAVLGDTAQQAAERAAVTLAAIATPAWDGDAGGLVPLPGALGDHTLQRHRSSRGEPIRGFLVEDPSRVLVTQAGRTELARRGWRVFARHAVPLVAVTSNPSRPGGIDDAPTALQDALATVLAGLELPVPVVDVVHGLVLHPGRTP